MGSGVGVGGQLADPLHLLASGLGGFCMSAEQEAIVRFLKAGGRLHIAVLRVLGRQQQKGLPPVVLGYRIIYRILRASAYSQGPVQMLEHRRAQLRLTFSSVMARDR